MLGVIATGGFTQEKQLDLVLGEKVDAFGHQLTFTGYNPIENGKKYAFNIEIKKGDNANVVAPVMYIAEFNNSLMREPDILNSITNDFYVSPVSYSEGDETHGGSSITLKKGDITEFNGSKITFDSFNFPTDAMKKMQDGLPFEIGAKISVQNNGNVYLVEPAMVSEGGNRSFRPAEVKEANLLIELTNLDAGGIINVTLSELDHSGHDHSAPKKVLTIEASVKPYINLVWAGVVIMVLGFLISVIRRTEEAKQ